jgi:hypothetical protein
MALELACNLTMVDPRITGRGCARMKQPAYGSMDRHGEAAKRGEPGLRAALPITTREYLRVSEGARLVGAKGIQ